MEIIHYTTIVRTLVERVSSLIGRARLRRQYRRLPSIYSQGVGDVPSFGCGFSLLLVQRAALDARRSTLDAPRRHFLEAYRKLTLIRS